MATEIIAEFKTEGLNFYVSYKPSVSYLWVVEHGERGGNYRVASIFEELYDAEVDFEPTKEQCIEKAKDLAFKFIIETRDGEKSKMEELYKSKEMQKKHSVYHIRDIEYNNNTYPMIWASHNYNCYFKVGDEWEFCGCDSLENIDGGCSDIEMATKSALDAIKGYGNFLTQLQKNKKRSIFQKFFDWVICFKIQNK